MYGVLFCAFIMNCENPEFIWLKYSQISETPCVHEGNGIVSRKLVGCGPPDLAELVFGSRQGKGCRPLL